MNCCSGSANTESHNDATISHTFVGREETIRRYGTLFALLLAIGIGAWLFYNRLYLPRHRYHVVTPHEGNLSREVFGVGRLEATQTYTLTAPEGGTLLQLNVRLGDRVRKGQLLGQTDPVDLPSKIEAAKLEVQKSDLLANAARQALDAQVAREALAHKEYLRTLDLRRHNASSQEQLDKTLADYNVSVAQTRAARLNLQTAQKSTAIARAELAGLMIHLKRTRLLSPADGVVIAQKATVGQSVLPNQAILQIVDPNDLRIVATIDERLSGDLKVGQKARITLRSKPEKILNGIVTRIDPQADPITLEKQVEITLAPLPARWSLHEEAQVWIRTGTLRHTILVPATALVYRRKEVGVWTIHEGKAHFHPVRLLGIQGDQAALSGIDDHTPVILPTPHTAPLAEGVRVVRRR
ncbi:efflux RND transporter periplasmic adaptor subunit [Nitratifractor sp.]